MCTLVCLLSSWNIVYCWYSILQIIERVVKAGGPIYYTKVFVSAMQAFVFLCLLLLILTFEVCIVHKVNINMISMAKVNTGQKHFLIEVEEGEVESTDADNSADKEEVGTKGIKEELQASRFKLEYLGRL